MESNWNVHQLLKALYWILHDSLARRDEYMQEGGTEVFPLRYILIRYLVPL